MYVTVRENPKAEGRYARLRVDFGIRARARFGVAPEVVLLFRAEKELDVGTSLQRSSRGTSITQIILGERLSWEHVLSLSNAIFLFLLDLFF